MMMTCSDLLPDMAMNNWDEQTTLMSFYLNYFVSMYIWVCNVFGFNTIWQTKGLWTRIIFFFLISWNNFFSFYWGKPLNSIYIICLFHLLWYVQYLLFIREDGLMLSLLSFHLRHCSIFLLKVLQFNSIITEQQCLKFRVFLFSLTSHFHIVSTVGP